MIPNWDQSVVVIDRLSYWHDTHFYGCIVYSYLLDANNTTVVGAVGHQVHVIGRVKYCISNGHTLITQILTGC